MLCQFSDALGTPGEGVHAMRIPGTNTPAADYVMTLAGAWLISATTGAGLVDATIVLFLLGVFLHKLFCVRVGAL